MQLDHHQERQRLPAKKGTQDVKAVKSAWQDREKERTGAAGYNAEGCDMPQAVEPHLMCLKKA